MKLKTLSQPFFNRPTLLVARELLGKYIVHRHGKKLISLMITEVEAYDGPDDLASHASRKRYAKANYVGKAIPATGRAAIMFGPAGYFYIFFTYGIHWMANIVTGPKNYPAAILLRAGEYRNPKTGESFAITGPARLAKFLKIDGAFNGELASRATGLWFEDRGVYIPRSRMVATRRVGVAYAGPVWGEKEWNFKVKQKQLV